MKTQVLLALRVSCIVAAIAVPGASLPLALDPCISNATVCQCSVSLSPSSCVVTLGNGNCLLRPCDDGYACSCSGYELCSVVSTSAYNWKADVQPSSAVPFQCAEALKDRVSVRPTGILGTFRSATHAVNDAWNFSEEMSAIAMSISENVRDVQLMLAAANLVLKEVEKVSESLYENEIESLYDTLNAVYSASEQIASYLLLSVQDVEWTRHNVHVAHELWREAYAMEEEGPKKPDLPPLEKEETESTVRLVRHLGHGQSISQTVESYSEECVGLVLKVRGTIEISRIGLELGHGMVNKAQEASSIFVRRATESIGKAKQRQGG